MDNPNYDEEVDAERHELLNNYCARMRGEYMLDYLIWRYILVEEAIKKRCSDLDDDCPEDDALYNKLVFWRRYHFERMKVHRVAISKGDEACFMHTLLVDRDELYKIDQQ